MRHAAKVDWFIGLGALAGIVVPTVSALTTPSQWGFAASLIVAFLVFGFCWPQWYETAPDALVIRAGFTTRRIPYPAITAAHPSASNRSSFALSLDRVEIEYRYKSGCKKLLIAPKNQPAFFADLTIRAPQLSGQNPAISYTSIA